MVALASRRDFPHRVAKPDPAEGVEQHIAAGEQVHAPVVLTHLCRQGKERIAQLAVRAPCHCEAEVELSLDRVERVRLEPTHKAHQSGKVLLFRAAQRRAARAALVCFVGCQHPSTNALFRPLVR